MMLEQKVVKKVNQIKDFLWLGDVKKVREIIFDLVKTKGLAELRRSFEEVSRSFKVVQETSKDLTEERKGLRYELSLAKEFKERIKDPSKIREAVAGLLVLDQEELLRKLEGVELLCEVVQKPSYRYVIFENPPKYEVRALIEGVAECNIKELVRRLDEVGFKVLRVGGGRHVGVAAFSTQSYVEVWALPPKVSINVSLLSPEKEKARELGEMVMDALTS